uniref:Exocyst subunit Exo70 family protein n=1 Tax=Arundo donax TaxID=35708 RepID=A0A0A9DW46_ARUDO
MLHELKVLIQKRASRTVPEGGGVHEVTRYVMNYIRLLLHHRSSIGFILAHNDGENKSTDSLDHIVQDLIICLEAMLNRAAETYDSGDLQCFFLMNNLHFVVKQVEGLELSPFLGHTWVQVHKDFIDQFMETYVDLSWGPVVSSLSTSRSTLGRCFRQPSNTGRFCLQFDSTYYNQEHWKVEDPLLREVVRRAVCNKVISAYQAHFKKSGKVQRQYDRYTPELLEVQLMHLFEGRPG